MHSDVVSGSLTVLVSVVGPVWALIRIISRNAELQRGNAREVFIIWGHNKRTTTLKKRPVNSLKSWKHVVVSASQTAGNVQHCTDLQTEIWSDPDPEPEKSELETAHLDRLAATCLFWDGLWILRQITSLSLSQTHRPSSFRSRVKMKTGQVSEDAGRQVWDQFSEMFC